VLISNPVSLVKTGTFKRSNIPLSVCCLEQ
jgi:hypothetical protein